MSGRESRFWVVGAADATFGEIGQRILAGGRVVGRDGRARLAVRLDLGAEQTALSLESLRAGEVKSTRGTRQAARSAAVS